MYLLHTGPASLGRVLRRILRLGNHGDSLWRAELLCKPFDCHDLRRQTSSRPEISFRAGFWRTGDAFHSQKPQRKTSFTLRKTDRSVSFPRQFICKSPRPYRASSGARDTLAQSIRYHNRKLYSS